MFKAACLLPALLSVQALSATISPCPASTASYLAAPQARTQEAENDKVTKTITKWLKLYRKGSITPDGYLSGNKSLLEKAGLDRLTRPPRLGGGRGWRGGGRGGGMGRGRRRPVGRTGKQELAILLYATRRIQTVAGAKVVLAVAAVGIDREYKYAREMIPRTIRRMGEQALAKMKDRVVRDYVVTVAKGPPGGARGLKLALQIAALRSLARGKDAKSHVRLFESLLTHHDAIMRLAVAEGLGKIGEPRTVERLTEALENERSPSTVIAMVWAIRDVHNNHRDRVNVDHLRRAVIAASKHLLTVDQRPTCQALIEFLERFRYRDSVPPLITLLERFKKDSSLARANKLTAYLRERAYQALRMLTGAILPMDKPDEWREFWKREGHNIDPTRVAQARASASGGNTVTTFFGIPVRGRRVVFIIDLSGSMSRSMPRRGKATTANPTGGQTRKIDKAKQELLKAVRGLTPEHKFNVVLYSADVRRWRKALVPASSRNKKSLASSIAREGANGGTNLFGGLKSGLEMKSLVYGGRYDSNVDEIFVLSDGMPTVGEVTNMEEILRLVSETNRYSGVRINAVYLGSKSQERRRGNGGLNEQEGAEFMEKLAKQNGGTFAWPVNSGR